jgi:hypothetical protein
MAPVAPAQRRSGVWVNVLLGVAAVIAVGGVAFAIGRSTAPASAATIGAPANGGNFVAPNGGDLVAPNGSFDPNAAVDPNGGPAFPGNGPRGLFGGGGATLDGTVTEIDGDSMTITLASGDTMTVRLDGETTYHASTPATAADVAVGDDVAVRVSGGAGFDPNGNGNGGANGGGGANGPRQDLTASDVTVSR